MKLNIAVCLSPQLLPLYPVEQSVVIVVDILRATTSMVTALANGTKEVIPVEEIAACKSLKSTLPHAISAGERDGKIIAGLDKGNDPLSYIDPEMQGKTLIITTTNGTRLIHKAIDLCAKKILIGAFLNLQATAQYLRKLQLPILIACAGWKDKVNAEDTLYAGALCEALKEDACLDCDSALMAQILYKKYKENKMQLLIQTSHYRRLDRFSKAEDLAFCVRENEYPIVASYEGRSIRRMDC